MNTKETISAIVMAIVAVTIFAAMINPASAGQLDISKETHPDSNAEYTVGALITYELTITNPNTQCGCTVDIYDRFPYETDANESTIAENVHLAVSGQTGDSVTYYVTYVVNLSDIRPDGRVWNRLRISGIEDSPCNGPLEGSVWESSVVYTDITFDFTPNATGCMEVKFTGESTGPVAWHRWDFNNDGTPDTAEILGAPNAGNAPTHTYTSCGNKQVRLYGESVTYDPAQKIRTIDVACRPTVSVGVNPYCVEEAGDIATFSVTHITYDSPVSYQWTFNDGGSGSSDTSPTTTRAIDGEVEATLTIVDELDCEAYDRVVVGICVERQNVPLLTPAGMLALIGMLGIVGAGILTNGKRRS